MSPPTLLLVEDDFNDRLLLRRALSKLGARWQVQEVGDGEDALRYLQGLPPFTDRSRHPLPHLILLDLKLPRRSGWEVLTWMRQRPPFRQIPVVVLSSSTTPQDIQRAYEHGANAYFAKPTSPQDLPDLLRQILTFWEKAQLPPLA